MTSLVPEGSERRPTVDVRTRPSGMLPNFLIIGAMRSGTSYLTVNMRTHPDIFMAERKELHFFDSHYERGMDWYRGHFVGATNERAVGEATPHYLYYEHAIPRIAEHVPEARLIASLRNPVDRAYSHYLKQRASWGGENRSFADAVADERRSAEDVHSVHAYVNRGHYGRQLERLARYFPKESIKILVFEESVADAGAAFRSIFDFLGVDPSFEPPEMTSKVGSFRSLRSKRFEQVLSRLPRGALRRRVSRWNTRNVGPPQMDPKVRRQLRSEFADDVAAVEGWLGRSVDVWKA